MLPLEKGGVELGQRPALDPSTSVAQRKATVRARRRTAISTRSTRYELTGWYADQRRAELRPLKGELADKFFQQQAAGMSAAARRQGPQRRATRSRSPARVTVTQNVACPATRRRRRNIPRVRAAAGRRSASPSDAPSASLSTRKTPLWVGVPRTERGDISVQIPAGWKVAYVPPKLEGTAEGVKYSSACEAAGQTVTCNGEITLDKLVVPADKYGAFRDAMTKLQAYERRIVLLPKVVARYGVTKIGFVTPNGMWPGCTGSSGASPYAAITTKPPVARDLHRDLAVPADRRVLRIGVARHHRDRVDRRAVDDDLDARRRRPTSRACTVTSTFMRRAGAGRRCRPGRRCRASR